MAQIPMSFNPDEVEPQEPMEFARVPDAWYAMKIVTSDVKATKNGRGRYLALDFVIVEGPHIGKRFTERMNIVNDNAKTVEIAKGQLSALCRSAGVGGELGDSVRLHEIPVDVKLGTEGPQNGYDAKNKFTGFKPLGTNSRSPEAQAAQVAPMKEFAASAGVAAIAPPPIAVPPIAVQTAAPIQVPVAAPVAAAPAQTAPIQAEIHPVDGTVPAPVAAPTPATGAPAWATPTATN